jgi:hypothetical protein
MTTTKVTLQGIEFNVSAEFQAGIRSPFNPDLFCQHYLIEIEIDHNWSILRFLRFAC